MSDPVTLAREVLMRDAEADAIDDRVGYDASSSLYVENGWSAPALARAALRVEALADILERESDGRGKFDSVLAYHASEVKARTADRIRAALKGDDA